MRRRLSALVIAVVALAGCADDEAADPPDAAGARVALVGDSLTVGIEERIADLAADEGIDLDLSAQSGRRIPEGIPELERLAPGADLVVVALGTNDAAATGVDESSATALIESALAAIDDDQPVLWVNVYRDAGDEAGQQAQAFNRALVAAAGRHDELVVLDWASYVADHPEVVAEDRVHDTPEGAAQRARWLRDAIVDTLER